MPDQRPDNTQWESDPASGLDPREQLRQALDEPALEAFDDPAGGAQPGAEAQAAAYDLAVALGNCRLFGVEPGEDLDGTLPPDIALAAAREAERVAAAEAERAGGLGPAFDGAEAGEEQEDLACGALEGRMELWAAAVAVDESYEAAVEAAAGSEDPVPLDPELLGEALDRLGNALADLDDRLREAKGILSVAAGTRLLSNWREALAPPYRGILPWWLDGTLEREAEAADRELRRWTPGPEVWRIVAEEVEREERGRKSDQGFRGPVPPHPPLPLGMPPVLWRERAAAGDQSTLGASDVVLRWTSPDGSVLAFLSLPSPIREGADKRFAVSFKHSRSAGGNAARELEGSEVALGVSRTTVNAAGHAEFTLDELLAAGDLTRLAVAGTPWALQEQT